MKTVFVTSRILLGLIFLAAGLSGFILLGNPPPAPPGLAGEFQRVFFQSHWVVLVNGVEFLAGAFLLANRYVPLALTLLGAVISNILAFHITIMPAGLPVALFVTLLWTIVASQFRSSFAPLFARRAEPDAIVSPTRRLGHARA